MIGKAKLDLETVRKKTEAYLTLLKLQRDVDNVVLEALKGFEGKVINARLATAVEKAVKDKISPKLSVSWRNDYSWNALRIWGGHDFMPWDSAYETTINYHSDKGRDGDGRFHFDYWLEKYRQHTDYEGRIAKTEQALRQIAQKVQAFNDAHDALEAAYSNLDGLAHWSS